MNILCPRAHIFARSQMDIHGTDSLLMPRGKGRYFSITKSWQNGKTKISVSDTGSCIWNIIIFLINAFVESKKQNKSNENISFLFLFITDPLSFFFSLSLLKNSRIQTLGLGYLSLRLALAESFLMGKSSKSSGKWFTPSTSVGI